MVDRPHDQEPKDHAFADAVGVRAARKLAARKRGPAGLYAGLGMIGMVGWSVVVPTLLGAGLGLWLDGHTPDQHRWTLALLVAGLCLGCVNAWYWVAREDRAMHEDDHDE